MSACLGLVNRSHLPFTLPPAKAIAFLMGGEYQAPGIPLRCFRGTCAQIRVLHIYGSPGLSSKRLGGCSTVPVPGHGEQPEECSRESSALGNRICEEARKETFLSFLLVSAGPGRRGLQEMSAALGCVGKLFNYSSYSFLPPRNPLFSFSKGKTIQVSLYWPPWSRERTPVSCILS